MRRAFPLHRLPQSRHASALGSRAKNQSLPVCLFGSARLERRSLLLRPSGNHSHCLLQSRHLHVALVAPGLGDAFLALPGAGKDKQGHITVPVPDPRLEVLAKLERTSPVPATVEVVEMEKALADELMQPAAEGQMPELSGSFLSVLRASDAVLLAVPCRDGVDPIVWLKAAEQALISADLDSLEKQVCKGGTTGVEAELDVAKLTKALSTTKDKNVKRDAAELVRDVLAPGLMSLRERLRAGMPARQARPGLESTKEGAAFSALDRRFEQLAPGWLNAVVTWKPMLVLADVPEADAGITDPVGNQDSRRLADYAMDQGMPCLTACVALESEVVGLQDEPDFLNEYLESFSLKVAAGDGAAGEKEARAWACRRVRKDDSALPFCLGAPSKDTFSEVKVAKKGAAKGDDDAGVPAFLAARAIHTSFESRVTGVMAWRFEDLEAAGVTPSGPGAKDRVKSEGKMRKLSAQAPLADGDVVEFVLK